MKNLTSIATITAFVLSSAGMAFAAGPTVVESEPAPEVAEDDDFTPAPLLFGSLGAGGAAVAVLGVAAVAAAASGGGDGGSSTTTTE